MHVLFIEKYSFSIIDIDLPVDMLLDIGANSFVGCVVC
jgi:hypothetical protein